MDTPFTACLLAGGKSSRMGRDKAGVEFEGEPLWQRQLRTLQQTGAQEILISGCKEACYGECGHPVIEDRIKECGPLAGVSSLLAAATHPLVVILAIDMPFVTADFLAGLVKQCTGGYGAVAEKNGFYQGLAAVFPKKAALVAARILHGGDHSMQNFVRECVKAHMVKIVRDADEQDTLFKSLNSEADLADILA